MIIGYSGYKEFQDISNLLYRPNIILLQLPSSPAFKIDIDNH